MSVVILGQSLNPEGLSVQPLRIPLYLEHVAAGFPSPAQDYVEDTLDLNELCIQRPAATFFVRVEGESMTGAGIFPKDILVVDRSLTATHGDIVIACIHGEMTVKELELKPCVRLLPHNPKYSPIDISAESELEIFGVVTNVVRRVRRSP
ncbi:translesion error-prone DNA polymerase V autoproteolytic subunit [Marinobacterium lutimaris]|uniref:SOS response UmuD protein. Serine peptidase. MEROPS family S24 n=1 Tax=Marinobacterium lutimaris TaxID=568106 RepID=A0A1H6DSW6_9GAMM|nr:translesion error-prone DNA polymerase V autoproteolytic subunit [Marinobacterium lutimaris]SEG88310.1 SOS response UmuD protein. Serine peptidase. MEROPS family S24 [Marinobacterium lutimaris]